MRKYLYNIGFFVVMLFAIAEQVSGQACSATWNLNSSVTPVIVGAITAPSHGTGAPTFGSGVTAQGNLNPNYGTYGQSWPTSSTAPNPSTATDYIQFSVTPTGSCNLNITSINFNSYNNEPYPSDYQAVFWSTSSTFASSTQIVTNLSTPSGLVNYTNNAITASCTAGQTIYFRVYFYYAYSSSVYYGVKSMVLSGTTSSCCSAPTTQATSMTFSSVQCTQMNVGWTNGTTGTKRIVVAKAGSAVTGTPTNNTTYTANTVFGSGSTIAAGEYVVFNNVNGPVTVTGLTSGVTYYYKVFEYNCAAGSEKYYTTSPLSGSQATTSSTAIAGGPDQYICTATGTATMAATGTGTWTQLSGPGGVTITSSTSPTTTITGLSSGTYEFRWTQNCGTAYDDVVIVRQ